MSEEREETATTCQDLADNDNDGFIDCADPECSLFVFCQPDARLSDVSEDEILTNSDLVSHVDVALDLNSDETNASDTEPDDAVESVDHVLQDVSIACDYDLFESYCDGAVVVSCIGQEVTQIDCSQTPNPFCRKNESSFARCVASELTTECDQSLPALSPTQLHVIQESSCHRVSTRPTA